MIFSCFTHWSVVMTTLFSIVTFGPERGLSLNLEQQLKFSSYLSTFPQILKDPQYVFSPVNLDVALNTLAQGSSCKLIKDFKFLTTPKEVGTIGTFLDHLTSSSPDPDTSNFLNLRMIGASNDDRIRGQLPSVWNPKFSTNVQKYFRSTPVTRLSKNFYKMSEETRLTRSILDPSKDPQNFVNYNEMTLEFTWKEPFSQTLVSDEKSGSASKKLFMEGKDMTVKVGGYKKKSLLLVKKSDNGNSKMVIIVPQTDRDFVAIEKAVLKNPQSLLKAMNKTKDKVTDLYLPFMKIDSSINLAEAMAEPFNCLINDGLDKITQDGAFSLDKMVHKVEFEVNPNGISNLGHFKYDPLDVKQIPLETLIAQSAQKNAKVIVVDKPFLFYFMDETFGAILYKGKFSRKTQ